MRRSLLALALVCAGVPPALAQQTAGVARPVHAVAVTVTGTSALALAATGSGGRGYLAILNQSATDTIACAFGATAVIRAAGQLTLAPSSGFVWDAGVIPTDAINCISSGSSTPLTILW